MKIHELRKRLGALHADDTGEVPLGAILLVGLIVIPVVILLFNYSEEVTTMFNRKKGELDLTK